MAKKSAKPRHTHTRPKPEIGGDNILELVRRCGGYEQTAKLLGREGIVNPGNGRPYTKSSIKRFCTLAPGWPEFQKEIEDGYKTFGKKIDALLEKIEEPAKGATS